MWTRKATTGLILAVGLGNIGWFGCRTQAADPPDPGERTAAHAELNTESLLGLQARIKPQTGESRWLQIPWFLDLHEARQKAAAEGKPLFIYSGGGATGIGAC